ncbi:hypothetical protein PTI98_000018 [Pleurotus ostreatus]|nr:hypothetical protein PTI98_000018 [Pleurotus ostreatus]
MLARSKQGALHIQWTRPLLDRSVLSAVSSQILRIQDLDICGQSLAILDFFPSKNRALPEMQRLALRRQVRATDAPPISMERVLSMDMPRLHTLELQNIYLPSIRVFQPSPCLQTLHITTPKRLLSLPDILTVLRATPTLHDLTLTHALFLTPPSPSAREDPKYALVDLAQLTSLSVSCNHFRDIALLLQHVRYPCSARVLLRSVTFPHEAGLTEPGCLEVLTAVLSRWAQSTSAGLADRMWLLNKFAWDFKIGVALGEVPLLDIHCEEGGWVWCDRAPRGVEGAVRSESSGAEAGAGDPGTSSDHSDVDGPVGHKHSTPAQEPNADKMLLRWSSFRSQVYAPC